MKPVLAVVVVGAMVANLVVVGLLFAQVTRAHSIAEQAIAQRDRAFDAGEKLSASFKKLDAAFNTAMTTCKVGRVEPKL